MTRRRLCIIPGMPRASTTFLYHTLAGHPSVFVPARKEIEYFSLNFHRGPSWYDSYFSSGREGHVGFDISPLYFFDPNAPTRIADYGIEAMIVLVVRRPSEFAVSFYNNRMSSGTFDSSFAEFLAGFSYHKDGSSLAVDLSPGSIASNIERFRSILGENLLIIDYRLIEIDPLHALRAIESHIEVEPYFSFENFKNVRINSSRQMNIRFINYLMHQRWFADGVTRFVPKALIMWLRYLLQTTVKHKSASNDTIIANEMYRIARSHFAQDDEYVEHLIQENGQLITRHKP